MPPASELLYEMMRTRADAVLLVVLAAAACAISRRELRRRTARGELSPGVCLMVVGVVFAGALLAELILAIVDYPVSATPADAAVARLCVLIPTAGLAGVLVAQSVRTTRWRAELRARADVERQLQLAKTAADEANRAKSDFLAVMSHEIRTPLNAVMGFATLLSESRLDDAQRGYLATITSEGARLGSLINDILDLTKIEEGRLALERLPFAPVETAGEVLRLLSARAAEKKLELRFEAQITDPLVVAGDPLRFRQVLVNLVDNAVKFTPRGSVTVFLTWSPPAAGLAAPGRLAVRVCDTGIGIAEEKLKDLFQMFMQADTSTTRRYGGTGLGLAICQRLVCLMGGEIGVESRAGEGSEFKFTLPMTLVPLPGTTATVPPVPPPPTQAPRVLIVDDMETNRFLLEVFLRRNGFAPQLAAGGEEAVQLASTNSYDAILMDLQMPDVDGYTATRRIRSAESFGRRTPIIALTATIGKGTREKCLAAGMDDYLTKPLDLQKFKALLSSFIASGAMLTV